MQQSNKYNSVSCCRHAELVSASPGKIFSFNFTFSAMSLQRFVINRGHCGTCLPAGRLFLEDFPSVKKEQAIQVIEHFENLLNFQSSAYEKSTA